MKGILFKAAVLVEKIRSGKVREANRLMERASSMSKTKIAEMKDLYFRELVNFCYKNNRYYRRIMNELDTKPTDFGNIDDLKKLPPLTKSLIKSERDEIVTASIHSETCLTRTSGGTTGEPIYIEVDEQTRLNELYAYYRGLYWMGWRPGQSMVKFFGGSLGGNNSPTIRNKIKKWVSGESFLPAFELDRNNASRYLDAIKERGETYVQGYVSTIYSLANYVREFNYKGLKIIGAFTTAEQLPKEQADFISDTFDCEVKGFYGCAEVNCLGFQTEMNGPYIVPEEIVHIDQNNHPETGIKNTFFITSLHNRKTPLLRYLNGDNGVLGSSHPIYLTIDELHGRTADMFLKPDGSYISSILATQTMQITGLTHKVKRYQLVQDDIGHITFFYEPFEENLSKSELGKILSMYQKRMGDELLIEPIRTDEFIKSSSGKHRLMINKLAN